MISSTIGELAAERKELAQSLESAGLADGWLFEFHATAAGGPPEERYLRMARSCDLFVVIIAAQGSQATEAEYQAAYDDNPRKILPFLVGDVTDPTKAFRTLIESRHTRVHRKNLTELAPAVVAAITDSVRSGEIVRLPLVEALDTRLRLSEQVVGAALPLGFIPTLSANPRPGEQSAATETIPVTALPTRQKHIVLEGIGGSGKTYAALATARYVSRTGVLPVVVTPTSGASSLQELLVGAFESVRFFPGDALLQQLARDGQLAVIVDGVDGIASDERRRLLHDVDEFGKRFPRLLVICCLRRALPEELRSFDRFTLQPLSDRQTADMFGSIGEPQIRSFPVQVADLARWPLWAWALLEVGPSVTTGLVLLQELLEHRVRRSGAYPPIENEFLTEAAAVLAYEAWPQPALTTRDALMTLATWGTSSSIKGRFAVPPAETIIERLTGAGIVHLTADELVFAHPLFATYLGARHAATAQPMNGAMADDAEFAMFATALMGEDREGEKLAHLLRHGPVGQARYLRLVPAAPREAQPSDPIAFASAVERLSGSAADCIVTDGWTAWRASDTPCSSGPEAIQSWLAAGDVTFLPGNVFRTRSPIDVATIASLTRFKDHVNRQRPQESRFDRPTDAELKRLRRLPREELNDLILQTALDWRREWREQAAALEFSTLPEAFLGEGDPQVRVYEDWLDPGIRIGWGDHPLVTWVSPAPEEPRWDYRPLSDFLAPGRDARIYEGLVQLAERALGCAFSSQAWSRPELVAAWAW